MRNTFLLVGLALVGVASIALSPKRAEAFEGTKCYCVGGCNNYVYLNPCDGGMCSWACNTNPPKT